MATDKVTVVRLDTQPAQVSAKELKKQLKELKDTMLSCEQGTEEYNQALIKAAEIQHTLKEQTEQVNASAMDFGQIVGNATKVVGGMVAGFQAAKATMNLFGIENKAVLESLEKMQNLMALTQALPSLEAGYKAFKNLSTVISTTAKATSAWGKALISTGLGALIVGLGMLIANFDKISQWLDELTGQTNFLGEVGAQVVGGLYAGWAALVQVFKAIGNAIVTYVTTPFKSVWAAIQAFSDTEGSFGEKLKAAGRAMKDNFVNDWKEVGDDFKEIGNAASEAFQKGYQQGQTMFAKENKEEAKEEGKAEGKAKGEAKAEAEEAAYKKTLKAIDKSERDEMLKLQRLGLSYEEYVAKKKELEDEFTRKRIEAIQQILASMGEEEEGYVELQEQLIKLQDSLYKKPEKTNNTNNGTTTESEAVSTAKQISEAINASAAALNDFSNNKAWGEILKNLATLSANWDNLYADMKKVNSDIPEEAQKAYSAYAQVAAAGLGAVANLMNGLAEEQDTSNKEGFESAKKYQIAGATMSMLAGIASAWASSMQLMFPANIIVGSVLSTMMTALGIAQIMKIKKTQFGESGSAGSASYAPSTSAISTVQAPVQYTQDVQGASIEGAIQNSKVYVTETDITNTQNKVHVSESEARY